MNSNSDQIGNVPVAQRDDLHLREGPDGLFHEVRAAPPHPARPLPTIVSPWKRLSCWFRARATH